MAEPDPVTVALTLPSGGVVRARPGSEISLSAMVTRKADVQGGVKLTLSDPPEWLSLETGYLERQGGEVILKISPNAEPGNSATVLLNGTARLSRSPKDPEYNPIAKFQNIKPVTFDIDAISIQIIN